MNTRVIQTNFNAGEIAPELYGHLGEAKYQTGLTRCRNSIVLPQGPVRRRRGTEYCGQAAERTWWIDHTKTSTLNDTIEVTASCGLESGTRVYFRTAGVLPAPLVSERDYFLVPTGNDKVWHVAATAAQAAAGRYLDLTTMGSGSPLMTWVSDPRVFEFTFSSTQTMVIEMGHEYFHFYTEGGPLLLDPVETFVIDQARHTVDVNNGAPGWLYRAAGLFLVNGQRVYVETLSGGITGISTGNRYYARNCTPTMCNLSTTATGPLLAISVPGGTGTGYIGRVFEVEEAVRYGGVTYTANVDVDLVSTGANDPPNVPWFAYANATYTGEDLGAGVYHLAHPYKQSELAEVQMHVTNDVCTITHPRHPVRELRRVLPDHWWMQPRWRWRLVTVNFGYPLAAPPGTFATPFFGNVIRVTDWNSSHEVVTSGKHGLVDNDTVFYANVEFALGVPWVLRGNSGYYRVQRVDDTKVLLYRLDEPNLQLQESAPFYSRWLVRANRFEGENSTYKFVAVDEQDNLGEPSAELVRFNPLGTSNAYNALGAWGVTAAKVYRIYKLVAGQYGLIGQTDPYPAVFKDYGLEPDLLQTLPIKETPFATDYPRTCGDYEQRRLYGSTTLFPQTIWFTRTGTLADLSYSLPLLPNDRIKHTILTELSARILHIVTMGQLYVLTDSAVLRLSPMNSDTLEPGKVLARPVAHIGASPWVRPLVVGNVLTFCAARGGHLLEMGFAAEAEGLLDGDLSLRAAHFFRRAQPIDGALQRAPYQIRWLVMDDGTLLGCTYLPNEKVVGWHQHDTPDGEFTSIAVVAEGAQDSIYVTVRRRCGNRTRTFIERIRGDWTPATEEAYHVDCGKFWREPYVDGSSGVSITLSGGTTWGPGDVLTLTAPVTWWTAPVVAADVAGSAGFELPGGARVLIVSRINDGALTVRVVSTIPAAQRNTPVAGWRVIRREIRWGLGHLLGETVKVFGDGAVHDPLVVSATGRVTLIAPVRVASIGLPFTSEIETLPVVLQADGAGQGRQKNVSQAWVRVIDSYPFVIGAGAGTARAPGAGALNGEVAVQVPQVWTDSGSVRITQADPVPLEIAAITLQAAIGG